MNAFDMQWGAIQSVYADLTGFCCPEEARFSWEETLGRYPADKVFRALSAWKRHATQGARPTSTAIEQLILQADKQQDKFHADEPQPLQQLPKQFLQSQTSEPVRRDFRQWALDLERRFHAGEKLSIYQVTKVEEALGHKLVRAA